MDDIIERLKEAIESLNMTFNAFASKAKVDPSNFAKMLEGKQKITDKTISKLCSAHGLSVEWVKSGTGEMMLPTMAKGNFFSPKGIYAEDSEVLIGDAILKERVKALEAIIAEKDERIKELKERIEELKSK